MLASNGNSQTLEPSGSLFPLFLFCPPRRVSSSPLSFCRSQETRRGDGEIKQRARTEGRPRTQPTKQRRSLREQGTGWGSQTLFFRSGSDKRWFGVSESMLTRCLDGNCGRSLFSLACSRGGQPRRSRSHFPQRTRDPDSGWPYFSLGTAASEAICKPRWCERTYNCATTERSEQYIW